MDTVDEIIGQIKECKTRNEAAELYAGMLCQIHDISFESFESIHKTIVQKWSLAGLKYIKKRAWVEFRARLNNNE